MSTLPKLLYLLSGPIYEPRHRPVHNPHSDGNYTYNVDLRRYWPTHSANMKALSLLYDVTPAVVTYRLHPNIEWLFAKVVPSNVILVNKINSTQIGTRNLGLRHFAAMNYYSIFVLTRVDIFYNAPIQAALSEARFSSTKRNAAPAITAISRIIKSYVNDLLFIIPKSQVYLFVYCTERGPGAFHIHSHSLHQCMPVNSMFPKQEIEVRSPNDLYKLDGIVEKVSFSRLVDSRWRDVKEYVKSWAAIA